MMNEADIPDWLVKNVPLHLLKKAVALAETNIIDGLYWCWTCKAWKKFDTDNLCGVCKTARK